MGYCPRCGENSPLVPTSEAAGRQVRTTRVTVPLASPIVQLPGDLADGSVITYGGTRFQLQRAGDRYVLSLMG